MILCGVQSTKPNIHNGLRTYISNLTFIMVCGIPKRKPNKLNGLRTYAANLIFIIVSERYPHGTQCNAVSHLQPLPIAFPNVSVYCVVTQQLENFCKQTSKSLESEEAREQTTLKLR